MCKWNTTKEVEYHLQHFAKLTEATASCFCSVHLAFFLRKVRKTLFPMKKGLIIPSIECLMSAETPQSFRF